MNRPTSASQGLAGVNNSSEKIAMLNRLKQQQANAYKRKAEQFSVKKV